MQILGDINPKRSFFLIFICLTVVEVSFCGLTKGISPNICILCVCVIINMRSFEPFCVWILTKDEFVCAGTYKKFLDISICLCPVEFLF